MSGPSSYAVRMARLGAQIFGEVVRPTDTRSLKVVRLFREQPLAKRKEVYDWYPQHKIYYAMTQKLRFLGLFRSEHAGTRRARSDCRLCVIRTNPLCEIRDETK
uniref:Small ribosomal subunit protein mS33 n=1 Tax=Periophthalmus magnuspinnatus TaxID=409849 RepID=A0A3B4A632_9GOBI